MEGIDKLAKIIEFIKKKKKTNAQVEYQRYSKMPKDKAKQYIEDLEKKILKGDVDVGNISDEELEIFNQKPSQEDIIKAKKEKKRNIIIGVVSFVVFLVIFIVSGGGEDGGSSSAPDKINAWSISKQFVKKQLKSPSTAEFPWYDKSFVKDLGDCTFEVTGYVDGQNGFGATVRNNFVVTVQNKTCNKNDNWTLVSSSIY
tara:strand:- start:253 stop:852 length:600 start_codon:yes stop_codon:yes gene_type:complete